jgi:L-seryl-tRNA(Ser) seleniumtransferase
MVGGGSLPGEGVAGPVAAFARADVSALAANLRALDPPLIARVDEGNLLLDPRTVEPADDQYVVESLRRAAASA